MKKHNITVIIPVFNIAKRGFQRLDNSIYSLSKQNCDIIVSCGSWESEHHKIKSICKKYNVKYIHTPSKEFNKPILLNIGLKQVNTEYVMCTDVDYIFSFDFIELLEKNRNESIFICKKVLMLQNQDLSRGVINNVRYVNFYPNKYGKLADGACQFAHIAWFEYCGGYDERMSGWAAMDNDMTKRAKLYGLELYWLEEGTIYHQWHAVEKYRKARDMSKIKRNHKLLQNDQTIVRNIQK